MKYSFDRGITAQKENNYFPNYNKCIMTGHKSSTSFHHIINHCNIELLTRRLTWICHPISYRNYSHSFTCDFPIIHIRAALWTVPLWKQSLWSDGHRNAHYESGKGKYKVILLTPQSFWVSSCTQTALKLQGESWGVAYLVWCYITHITGQWHGVLEQL